MPSTRRTLQAALAAMVLVAAWSFPAAQNDEQTRDLEEQDRRYLDRLLRSREVRPETDETQEPSREALRAKILAEADRLIRERDHSHGSSEHYEVRTDDSRIDPEAVARLLESFLGFFTTFWSDKTELFPESDERSRAYLFHSFYKYNKLLTGESRFPDSRPAGHYRPWLDVVMVHTDSVPPEDLPDVIVHEAAHQLVEQRLLRGASGPPWLAEGLAGYFGYTRRSEEGVFEKGRVGGRGMSVFRGRGPGRPSGVGEMLERMRRALRSREPFHLQAVLQADPSTFYGSGIETRYAASWLLVHYLLHADDGAHAAAFERYLGIEAGGNVGVNGLYEQLGIEPAALEQAWQEYVRRFRLR